MNCPKCKNIELEKKKPTSPYTCTKCKGMWLKPDQIFHLDVISDEIVIDPPGNMNPKDNLTGICPEGHGIMIRAKVDIEESFYLEKCTRCGGVWFDQGEWFRVAEAKLIENLDNIWSKPWQKKQKEEKDIKKFYEISQNILGEEIFQSILDLSRLLKKHPEKTRAYNRAIALLHQELE